MPLRDTVQVRLHTTQTWGLDGYTDRIRGEAAWHVVEKVLCECGEGQS